LIGDAERVTWGQFYAPFAGALGFDTPIRCVESPDFGLV